jgi:superfamily II DNA or RNA helicase
MTCLDDDAPGRALSVIWERELGARIIEPTSAGLGGAARLDEPRSFAAYLHALKWSSVTATDAQLFQAPFRAGIHLLDHQLVPLKKALELPRVNLFIADDVGLGKTIEAGLVMQELMLRQRVDRVLVVCPASVTLQWRDELERRFGLRFEIFNRDFVARRRQERGFATPIWELHHRFIVSYQTLRRAEYYEPLLAFLGDGVRHKSMLVLDEAHVVAPASSSRYAIDTDTTRAVRQLAERFEHRLFLSATPHNGHSNSFAALLEMLDPQRFTRGTKVNEKLLEPVMVRRLKSDLRALGGAQQYPERKVLAVRLTNESGRWTADSGDGSPRVVGEGSDVEVRLSKLLAEYTALAAPGAKKRQLVFINLQKRLLSSIEAFHRTLSVHAAAFGVGELAPGERGEATEPEDEEYGAPDDLLERELDAETKEESAGLQIDMMARERLDQLTRLSSQHRAGREAKLLALLSWIRQHQCSLERGAKWQPRRVIIFTEYGDTLRYLREQLNAAFEVTQRGDERILTLTGGLGDARRAEVQAAFNSAPDEHPVRVLLATDAAREGINLQGHCADLFHYDVPWNPSRLEQRNGRIDRTLQPSPEVRCHYFLYTQRPEDEVLDTLARKVDVIQRELGSLGSVLMDELNSTLEKGIGAGTLDQLKKVDRGGRADTTRKELESQRLAQDKLKAELKVVEMIRERSRKVMDFDPALLRDALDVGFELSGAKRLSPGEGSTWQMPELARGWERTLDGLRPPKQRDEAYWQWRQHPLLPVTFEPPKGVADRVNHLHLSHPVAQRVLQRFLSQGFSGNDLSRVTVVSSRRDSVARVIVFGRLSLFGAGAARLHDQLVSVSAKWLEGGGKGHLKPFEEEADRKAIEQLETTLAEAPELAALPDKVKQRLLANAASDFAALWPEVEAEAKRRAEEARTQLKQRGAIEAAQLKTILETQRETIEEALGDKQLDLSDLLTKEEREQWRRDKGHLQTRLQLIEKELVEQPSALASLYDVRLPRVTPVGMVYLWPSTK